MRSLTLPITAMTLAFALNPSVAQDMEPKPAGDAAPMMAVDRDGFVKTVTSANEFEVRSSELAAQKAGSDKLKEAASMIVTDHKEAGEKLKMILEAKAVTPPPTELSPKHRKMMDQLNAAGGKDFEALYLDMQAQAHMEAVGLFRTYAGGGDDQEVIGFAKETLPSLENHLAHVTMLLAGHHQ